MPPNRLANLPGFRDAGPFVGQPSPFEHGIIAAVDQERWTVVVELHESGVRQYDVPIMSPYFYHERGQGMYCVPEIGAQCIVAKAGGQYFVVGFLPPVDPSVNDEEPVGEDLSRLASDQPEASTNQGSARVSYRNGREGDMLPGDYCLSTRARNRLKIFTNGNILVQASHLCTRIYSKLRNFIQDICVNYSLRTPGGEVNWINDADDGSVTYERTVKANIDDDEPSFIEEVGSNGDIVTRKVQTEAGVEQFSEQISAEGEAAYKFVAGAHEINVDAEKIEIKALSGAHTVTIDADGVHIVSTGAVEATAGTDVLLTCPTGVLGMAEGEASWAVNGNLTLTATGMITINPVGALILAP